ncbi:hypothetical protein AVEN_50302-1 [Araneus ventricosus]|uniref:Uncharacterized protein n=1 Tax=Araneus ventricosus TaxID=182803 RepID=A0A4Y2NPQ2_ARAVE|nr:hypothetical protein AVEN_50302-1 [Araneus ventricosus]
MASTAQRLNSNRRRDITANNIASMRITFFPWLSPEHHLFSEDLQTHEPRSVAVILQSITITEENSSRRTASKAWRWAKPTSDVTECTYARSPPGI